MAKPLEELHGLLTPGVLPEVFRRIFSAQRSGVLHLALGADRSDVEFAEGFLTGAETTLAGAHLGDLLVQIGFLSTQDRDACHEIAAFSDEKIEDTLLRHGILEAEQLAQGVALQLREIVARTLQWKGGVYTFGPQAERSGATRAAVQVDPRETLLDATWTVVGDPVIDGLLGGVTHHLRRPKDDGLRQSSLRLSPADAVLLSRVDGKIAALELLTLSSLSPDEAKASLAGLLAIGAVEYADVPPPISATAEVAKGELTKLAGRLNSPDPYSVLGVSPKAVTGEVRSVYLGLMRTCDPALSTDPDMTPILKRMANQVALAFKDIERRREAARSAGSQAEAVPAPPQPGPAERQTQHVGRPAPSAPSRQVMALAPAPVSVSDPAQAVDASARALSQGRPQEALAILHDAIPRLYGRARRLARVQKARVLLAVPNGAELAEEELKTVIAEDPGQAQAHALLGDVYAAAGSNAMALRAYGKALELDPRNESARAAAARLDGRPDSLRPAAKSRTKESRTGTFFRSIFRRDKR